LKSGLLLGGGKYLTFYLLSDCFIRVWRMPNARKILHATIAIQFFFRMFPISPTRKISTGLNVNVAPNTCGQLMNQLNGFNGL
jgi:hypothetical protein